MNSGVLGIGMAALGWQSGDGSNKMARSGQQHGDGNMGHEDGRIRMTD